MPVYKLYYFDIRGLAEPARQLFHLGGVKFEDIRLSKEDGSWDKIKSKTPFGQLPILKVDGFEIPQSSAIYRYLARKFGFAGKTAEEEAIVDGIVDQYKDFSGSLRQVIYAQRGGKSVDEVEKIKKEVFFPARDNYFKIIEGILEKNKSGWLVGGGLTWADLVVVENLVTLEKLGLFVGKEHKTLAALKKKVHAVPKLKAYIAQRPDTDM